MACNENIIKNMANEVTRNCQTQNINVEPEFVMYLIELLLLNPKYGKLFVKTLDRDALAYFVGECGAMIAKGGTPLNTLKMQFIMRNNYDHLQVLIDRRLEQVETCLSPLLNEILEAEPNMEDTADLKKIFRKISIYIILSSGLGNPAIIMNLKEGMAALESVFAFEELKELLLLPRIERRENIEVLMHLVSGVRLFNRDCKKGGEMIPDLPFDLIDAGKACITSLSNSLIAVMQRVNTLTSAVEDRIVIHEETGEVKVQQHPDMNVSIENFRQIFELLIFNRQYEIYVRRLLADAHTMVEHSKDLLEHYRKVLEELHGVVKYKTAVPVDTVFPLFIRLWRVWRAMQNTMYLVSTANRLLAILNGIQEHNKIPLPLVERMLDGKTIQNDEERMYSMLSLENRIQNSKPSSTNVMDNSSAQNDHFSAIIHRDKNVSFLGFCTMCLNVGALVPSNLKIGLIKHKTRRYGFSSIKMAARFSKDPERYVNETLNFARNNPQIINLLNMEDAVKSVRDVEPLIMTYLPKKKMNDKDVQTEVHPLEEYIEHNYSWDLWEWKRRACQWANIVKCQTKSTQTNYSHMRSEIQCQTTSPRTKELQTMKEVGIGTNMCNFFFWGLRGQIGYGQHLMDLVPKHKPKMPKPHQVLRCKWPCDGSIKSQVSLASSLGSGDPTVVNTNLSGTSSVSVFFNK
ncbi:hypothetical protein O0L34_g14676 [Tuta absoluta]|nr:hypothetical protein O0L34_g14676 [Tuta absoluta]